MSFLFKAALECLTGRSPSGNIRVDNMMVNDKYRPDFKGEKSCRTAQDIATEVINTLFSAEKKGRDLEQALNDIVTEYGWTENIGVAILNGLETALKKGNAMGQVMAEALEKATNAAVDFAREHPVYCTIIAIGVLVILAPWVLEAIGFGELGPIEETFASAWQARYAGYVPKGSLFSYLQRLGMVWRRHLLPKQAVLV